MISCNACGCFFTNNEKTCEFCEEARYCSANCKMEHSAMFHPGNLRSVDYLYKSVFDDEFPTNEKTIKDFGFANCKSQQERSNLLGLYIGLLRLFEIPTNVLHEHCVRDKIGDLIKQEYEKLPSNSRGEYYPWFLQNQHIVLNGKKGEEEAVAVETLQSAKFSIQDGKFVINYGYNAANSYYYLNVQDPRLAWRSGLAANVEKVTNDVDSSGEGVIMQLHTYSSSSKAKIKGNEVSAETLAVFLKSYGVSNSHIEIIKQGKSF